MVFSLFINCLLHYVMKIKKIDSSNSTLQSPTLTIFSSLLLSLGNRIHLKVLFQEEYTSVFSRYRELLSWKMYSVPQEFKTLKISLEYTFKNKRLPEK